MLWILLTLLGCMGEKTSIDVVDDEGLLCLDSTSPMTLKVWSPGCLSSSCDTVVASSCSASMDGDTAVIISNFEIETTLNTDCTADCGSESVTCTGTDSLTVDTPYAYGTESGTLADLPSCDEGPF